MPVNKPLVVVTIEGGIADVISSKGVQVVMLDYDVLKGGDMSDEECNEIKAQIELVLKQKHSQDITAELKDMLDALEAHAEAAQPES